MSNIPVPMIYGANDSAKIQNIISYINQLADTLSRELNSIGLPNLSQELREKIDGAISKHQDLSEYATKKFALNEDNTTYQQATEYTDGRLSDYAKESYVDDEIESLRSELDTLKTAIEGIKSSLDGYVTESELTSIIGSYATRTWVQNNFQAK